MPLCCTSDRLVPAAGSRANKQVLRSSKKVQGGPLLIRYAEYHTCCIIMVHTRDEKRCGTVVASLSAARLKDLMAELVRGEVDGMCRNVPQQGNAASPVQPCQVSTSHRQPLDALLPLVSVELHASFA